jgi:histidyl-tRNA synthetase
MLIAKAPRGMMDLFCDELYWWRTLEKTINDLFVLYNYDEIRTPHLEDLALFKRGVGENTDIVEKEMFIFEDGDHEYCLRPENTAPVVRALIERGGISADTYEKLFYMGPMFRKERPQKGRLRQFHQFGVEVFGVSGPEADLEILVMMDHLFRLLGVKGIHLKINSLGLSSERSAYKEALKLTMSAHAHALCDDCKRRLETNPLRLLDCKKPGCQELKKHAPSTVDFLGEESRAHFEAILQGLRDLSISFEVDSHLVRGLDYYNRTVFEFVADVGLGSQNTVVAGGRYDGLFQTLGNKVDIPAIGLAGGIERLILILKEQAVVVPKTPVQVAIIGADDEGHLEAMRLTQSLRNLGVVADYCLVKRSVKAQMRRADKLNAQFAIIIGANEISRGQVVLKGLSDQSQTELVLDKSIIAKFLAERN